MLVIKTYKSKFDMDSLSIRFFYLTTIYRQIPRKGLCTILERDDYSSTFEQRISKGFYIPITKEKDRL